MLRELSLDQETWEQIVKRGRERIREWYPVWTDDNISDPGITLLELFSFLKEIQNFHMDQTGPAHYKKYLKLLGERPKCRQPAQTLVTFDVNRQTMIPAGTRMYAGTIIFETLRDQIAAGSLFSGFQTVSADGSASPLLRGEWLRAGRNLSLRPFGLYPKKGDRFNLLLSEPLLPGEPYGLFLGQEDWDAPGKRPVDQGSYDGYGFLPPAFLRLRVRTEKGWQDAEIGDDTFGLCQSGVIWFCFTAKMDTEAPCLQLILEECDYLIPPSLSRISLSMIPVSQQETRRDLPRYLGTGFPRQRFCLEEEGLSAGRFSIQVEDPSRAGEWREWSWREDLDSSGPEDCHYMVDGCFLVFGDGFHGLAPEGEIRVTQWVRTLGKGGNIKSGTITSLEHPISGILGLVNEADASGGSDEETLEQAFARYRGQSFRGERAVTLEDYESLVLAAPGLQIDECRACLCDTSPNRISIAVRPHSADGLGRLTSTIERNLYCYLEEKRLIGTRISLLSPEYVFLSVTCEAVGKVKYRDAKRLVEDAIRQWMSDRHFGQPILYGQLFGYLDTLPFVSEVKSLWLETRGRAERNSVGDVRIAFNGLIILREARCILYTDS